MKSWEREMMIQGEGRVLGKEEGRALGREEGEQKVNHLIQLLIKTSRTDEIERAVTDNAFQQELFEEFNL